MCFLKAFKKVKIKKLETIRQKFYSRFLKQFAFLKMSYEISATGVKFNLKIFLLKEGGTQRDDFEVS